MAAVSIAQAVIMVAVLMGINGLEPHYVGKTFGMAVLASMAFMSLICFGEMLLNRVGSYVMLVFMVVQLGAAGGTYPLDMAPHFYTVLHKYMPYSTRIPSHTIHGWTDRTGYCSICWNLSCVNISNDHLLPLQNEETGWRNIGT